MEKGCTDNSGKGLYVRNNSCSKVGTPIFIHLFLNSHHRTHYITIILILLGHR